MIIIDKYKSYGGGSTQAADDDENGVFKVSFGRWDCIYTNRD